MLKSEDEKKKRTFERSKRKIIHHIKVFIIFFKIWLFLIGSNKDKKAKRFLGK